MCNAWLMQWALLEINAQGNTNSLYSTSSRIDYIAEDFDFDKLIERNMVILSRDIVPILLF